MPFDVYATPHTARTALRHTYSLFAPKAAHGKGLCLSEWLLFLSNLSAYNECHVVKDRAAYFFCERFTSKSKKCRKFFGFLCLQWVVNSSAEWRIGDNYDFWGDRFRKQFSSERHYNSSGSSTISTASNRMQNEERHKMHSNSFSLGARCTCRLTHTHSQWIHKFHLCHLWHIFAAFIILSFILFAVHMAHSHLILLSFSKIAPPRAAIVSQVLACGLSFVAEWKTNRLWAWRRVVEINCHT